MPRFALETFYAGQFQDEAHALDPVCQIPILPPPGPQVLPPYQAGCYGLGVATGLRWTNYVSIFHREVPSNLDSYSARPDQ